MNDCGVSVYAIIPGKAEPSDKSEMVTQLIFGEPYQILDSNAKWLLIKNGIDSYECWIDKKLHCEISKESYTEMALHQQKRCGESFGFLIDSQGKRFAVPCSSQFVGYREGSFQLAGEKYMFDGRIARHDIDSRLRHAKRLLHAPYLWGGKTAMGIDCSGFIQVVFHCAGISLPRDAHQQAQLGETIDFVELAESGDLVFFDNDRGQINHVGMISEKSKIIHSSGSVRIDTIDHQGIYNAETKAYTHRMCMIKRLNL